MVRDIALGRRVGLYGIGCFLLIQACALLAGDHEQQPPSKKPLQKVLQRGKSGRLRPQSLNYSCTGKKRPPRGSKKLQSPEIRQAIIRQATASPSKSDSTTSESDSDCKTKPCKVVLLKEEDLLAEIAKSDRSYCPALCCYLFVQQCKNSSHTKENS